MFRYGLVALIAVVAGCSGSMASGEDGPSSAAGDGGSSGNSGTSGNGGAGGSGSAGKSSSGTGSGSAAPSGGSGGTSQGGSNAGGGDDSAGGTRGGKAGGGGATNSGGSGGSSNGGSGGTNGGSGGSAATGAGGTSGTGATTNHTNPLSQTLIDAFVKAHNDARASTSLQPPPSTPLPPVTWDAVLADAAYNYLSRCQSADGSLVDHNANRTKDYAALGGSDYVGENIYASSASSVDPSDAVDSWMSEASDYVPGDVSSAGHYTQVVWRDSVRIGCAIVNCPSVRFHNTVLCDYAPGGNINGQTPY